MDEPFSPERTHNGDVLGRLCQEFVPGMESNEEWQGELSLSPPRGVMFP